MVMVVCCFRWMDDVVLVLVWSKAEARAYVAVFATRGCSVAVAVALSNCTLISYLYMAYYSQSMHVLCIDTTKEWP